LCVKRTKIWGGLIASGDKSGWGVKTETKGNQKVKWGGKCYKT